MRIVTTTDPKFARGARALANSLHTHGHDVTILVSRPVGDSRALQLSPLQVVRQYYSELSHLHCVVVEPLHGLGLPTRDIWSTAIYSRFLIPGLFPDEDRILYLDADTLCLGDLSALAEIDFEGKPTAATQDPLLKLVSNHVRQCDLDLPSFYSGFLLMDIQKWIEWQIVERALAHLRTTPDRFPFPDQGALNLVHAEDRGWRILDQSWHHSFKMRPWPRNLKVLHYNGVRKPWSKDGVKDKEAQELWEAHDN